MFKSLGKALSLGKSKSSKSDPPPTLSTKHGVQLTKMAMVGLITTVGFLNEHSFQSDGLFIKNGDKAETEDTEKFILGGIISVGYLQSVKNILSITTAVRNIFTNHGPLIPSHYYEMFMSPLANLEQLILTIPSKNKELLESLMSLLAKITQIQNKQTKANIANLGSSLGILLFRDDEAPYTALDKDSLEYVNRIKVFNKLLTIFSNRLSKQMADVSPRNIAAANAAAASSSNKFNFANAPQQVKTTTAAESSQSAAPAPETHSIQDRSVKISFMGMSEKPDSETLQELCLKYGTVLNVGFKGDKFAVVLFSDPHEAFYCATDQDGKGLGDHFKIKYLGTKSYSTPSPPPPQPRPAAAVAAPQEELDDSVFVTPAELHSHEPPTFEDDDQTAAAPTPLKQVKTIPVKSTAVPVSAAAAAELQKSDSLDMVTEIKPLYPSARDRKKEEVMEVSSFYSRANTPLPGSAGDNHTAGGGGEGSKKGASPRKRNNKDFVPSPASNKAQQDRLRAMTVSTTNTSPDHHRNLNDAERSSPEGTVSSRGTAPFSEDEEGADGSAALTTESLKRHSGGHHQPNQSLGIIDLSMISAHNDNTILHTGTKQPLSSAAARNNAPAKGKVDGAEKVEKKHQFFTFDSGSETSEARSRSRLDTEESASVASGASHLEGTQFATQGQSKAASAAPTNLWSTIASKSKGKKVNKTNDSVAEIDNSRNNNTSGSSSGGWKVATKSPMSSPPTKLSTQQADLSHTPNALSLLSHRSEVEGGSDDSPDKRSDKKLTHAQQHKTSPLHIHTHNSDHNHTITEYKSPASPTSGVNTGRSSVNDEEDQGLMYSPGSVSSSVVKRQVRTIHVASPREQQHDSHNNSRDAAHRDSSYSKGGRHSDRSQDNSRSASKSSGNASHISSTDSAVEFAADYASQLHNDSTDSAVDFAADYESQLQEEDWSPSHKQNQHQHQHSELDHRRQRNDHREDRRDISIPKQQQQQQQQQQRRSSRGDHTDENDNNTTAMGSRSAIERSYTRHVSPQLRAASGGSDRILGTNKGSGSSADAQINLAAMHSLNAPNALNTLNTAVHAPSAFSTHYNPAAEHVIGHLQQVPEGSRPLLQAHQQHPHMSSPERLQKAKQDYLAYTALLHSQAAFNKQHTNRLINGQFNNNGGGDNSLLVLELQRQLQQMQAQVMMYQAKEADQIAESIRTEQAFQAETLALQLRVTQVESENSDLRETVRKLKLSQSHATSTIMSLESAKKSLELIVSSAQETAHRESLSTILAQQRLIGVLESTVTQLSTQSEKLQAELTQSRNVQYDSAKEGNKWKAAALSGDAAAVNSTSQSSEEQQQQDRQVVVRFTDEQSSEAKEGQHHSSINSSSGGEGAGEAKGGSPIHKALVVAVEEGDELRALRRDANQEMISFMDRMPAENKGYKSTYAEHRQLALQLLHKPTHHHHVTDGFEDEDGSSSSDTSGGDVVNVTHAEKGRAEVAGAVLRKIATTHSSPLKKQQHQQSSSSISGNTNSSSGGNKNRGEYIYSNDSHTVTYLPLSTTIDNNAQSISAGRSPDKSNQHSGRTRSELSRGINGNGMLGSGVADSEVPYSEQILEKVNQKHDQRAVYQLPYTNNISQQQHQFQLPPPPPPKYTPPDLIHTTPLFGAASISTIGLYDRIHSKIGSDFLSSSNRGSNNGENNNSSKPAYLSVKELYSSYGREPVHSAGAGYVVGNSGNNSRGSSSIVGNKQYNNQQLQQKKSGDYHSDILLQHALNMSNYNSSGGGKSSKVATRNSSSGGEWYSQKYE